MSRALPPLPGEHFACTRCAIAYPQVGLDEALAVIATVPGLARAVVAEQPDRSLRVRPAPDTWSATEYLCHVRDVYVAYTIRLYRTTYEDRPRLEPMLNDLRAARFNYADSDVAATLGELTAAVVGFRTQASRLAPDGWSRTATREPGEERTAAWLVRQAMHEGIHHVDDIRTGLALVPRS